MALAAGALSTLAQAPFFAWPILFATFPVLFWLLDGAGRRSRPLMSAATAAYAFGFGYFFSGLYWIGEAFLVEAEVFAWLLPFAITLLPAAMAAYWGLAGIAVRWAWTALDRPQSNRSPAPGSVATDTGTSVTVVRILVLALALSIAEIVRGHAFTGFPWNAIGLALTAPLELMQAAAVVGMYGLTPLTILVTTTPVVVLVSRRATGTEPVSGWGSAIAILVLTIAPLAAMYAFGAIRLAAPVSPPLDGVRVRIVQPSIPQREKWRPELQGRIFAEHLDLTLQGPDGRVDNLAGISHVIWPEAAMPFGPLQYPDALAAIGKMLPDNVVLLAGLLRRDANSGVDPAGRPGARVFNSLVAFDGVGQPMAIYDKVHLVPFGEYLPFPHLLESIGLQNIVRQRGGFATGPAPKPLMRVPGLPPIAPVICYEAIFPAEIVHGRERPGLIVIVTNDGWFGNTIGPPQHLHQARVRAVEQGVTVVRAANNGISAVIDPEGRILSTIDLNVRGTIDSAVPQGRNSVVSNQGQLSAAALILLLISLAVVLLQCFANQR